MKSRIYLFEHYMNLLKNLYFGREGWNLLGSLQVVAGREGVGDPLLVLLPRAFLLVEEVFSPL